MFLFPTTDLHNAAKHSTVAWLHTHMLTDLHEISRTGGLGVALNKTMFQNDVIRVLFTVVTLLALMTKHTASNFDSVLINLTFLRSTSDFNT